MRVLHNCICVLGGSLFEPCGADVLKGAKSEGRDTLGGLFQLSFQEMMVDEEAEGNGQIQGRLES